MKRRQVPPTSSASPDLSAPLVVQLLSQLGTEHFGKTVMAALQTQLPLTSFNLLQLSAAGRATIVATGSAYGDIAEHRTSEYIERGFDLLDPEVQWLSRRKSASQTRLWLALLRGPDLQHAGYREGYDGKGTRERLSLLVLDPQGQRLILNLYRAFALPPFSEADLACLEQLAPVLAATALAQQRLVRASAAVPPWQNLMDRLPRRERQVLDHLLAGHTNKEAARRLGISNTTALTYRYRAFRRLGIRTQRELTGLLKTSVASSITPAVDTAR